MIPIKYIKENNIYLDWYKIWDNENIYQTDINKNLDFEIFGVHRSSYSTFWTSSDTEYFISLTEKE